MFVLLCFLLMKKGQGKKKDVKSTTTVTEKRFSAVTYMHRHYCLFEIVPFFLKTHLYFQNVAALNISLYAEYLSS